MGTACSVELNIEIKNIIWIDPDIDKDEFIQYEKEIAENNFLKVKLFKNVSESMEYIKEIKFQETEIIINGGFYSEFVHKFKENIANMYLAPKIIIFTSDIKTFTETNKDYKNTEDKFYRFGGVVNTFKKVKRFLKNERENQIDIENKPKKIEESLLSDLSIEFIDNKQKLILPLFYKALINDVSNDNMKRYTNNMYNAYNNENDELKSLLYSIEPFSNIPIEILSKYYTRIFTVSNNLNKDIKNSIKMKKTSKILPYIQTLYEGIKLRSLPLFNENILYLGSILPDDQINIIKENFSKKVKHLPCSYIFSKNFLTFMKERQAVEKLLINSINETNYSKVLFILQKNDYVDYNLSTSCDLENISYFKNHKEVLFLPFSPFGVKEIREIDINREKVYEIKLVFLVEYSSLIENDKNLFLEENLLSESEFKNKIVEFGLIKSEKIENINNKMLYDSFKKYEEEIQKRKYIIIETQEDEKNEKTEIDEKEETRETDIKFDIVSVDENEIKENIAEIFIRSADKNKEIQIINSFENYQRMEGIKSKKDDWKFNNEKEIEENVQIKINDIDIDFTYTYKFPKVGIYKVEYIFNNNITKLNHMFYNCSKIVNLFLPKLDTKNVTNMNSMFCRCNSLTNLGICKFNTQSVTDMGCLFSDCISLKKVDISNFKTNNVNNMQRMFHNCKSLSDLKLSNFNTKNVSDMSEMFFGCYSLESLDLSNFNTQNVTNMIGMFNSCSKLITLNISNFKTHNVKNMYCMFSCCNSLKTLNLSNFNTQNVMNMKYMFLNCKSLRKINIENFNSQNVTDMNWMFNGCHSLKKSDIETKDNNILKYFDKQRIYMFSKTH